MASSHAKKIEVARSVVEREISNFASNGGPFAGALSSEGYHGGYRDALNDVLLVLSGVTPHRRNFWDSVKPRDVVNK
jgi:hypothetical protein